MSNKVKDISTESLRISTEDLLKTIFYNLDAAELQELYDWTGSDARKLRNNLKLKISTKKFAAKLSDSGVMLSPVDMGRARIDTIELVERSVARFTLGDEFDPAELMDDAAEAKLDPTVFNKMDFREIPRPKNILDWITGREFLNAMPFPRQLQVMLHFLEEYCPYCSDNDFLKDIHLSPYLGEDGIHQRPWTIQEIQERVQFTEFGACPKCKATYHDMLFDPMVPHKAPNELAMVCGQRCVSGDTILFTNKGIVDIQSLLPANPDADTFYPMHDTIVAGADRHLVADSSYYSGKRNSTTVTTECGYSIAGSDIHPVRVVKDGKPSWVKVPDLNIHDVVMISVGDDIWGSSVDLQESEFNYHHATHDEVSLPKTMTAPLARLLGYLVSDGDYNGGHIQQRVRVSVSDIDILNDFRNIVSDLFGIPCSTSGDETSLVRGKEGPAINSSFCSVDVRKWLEESCGVSRETARTKKIPSSILKAPKHIIASFLTGLYEGDGCIFVGKTKYDSYIDYTSTSKVLSRQIHMILLNMGVTASFRKCDTYEFGGGAKTGLHSYSVRITGPKEMKTFLDNVHMESKYKKEKAQELLSTLDWAGDHRRVPGSYTIMTRIMEKVLSVSGPRDVRKKLPTFDRWMYKTWNNAYCKGWSNPRGGFTEKTIKRMSDILDKKGYSAHTKLLRAIERGTIRLLYIQSIKNSGCIDLYDLHVPNHHRFVSNGFISHNSGKTRMSEMIMTYLNCRFQLLSPSPQQHFGEDMTQQLTSMFTALDLSQSADTLWGNYHIRIETAPWYKKYHSWLDYHGKKAGIEMYRIKDTYHSWAPTLLQDRLKPPFAKSMRGRTGYMMGIDEIGMFARGENAVRANADEVYQAMSNTLFTIRTDADALNRKRILTPTAPMVCVSSPWELLDKIMRLVRDAPKSPRRVAFHFATWEMNPKIYRDSDQVKAEFIDDEVKALRDWGAIPPLAENPFHTNMNAIDALPARHRPCFVQSIKTSKTKSGNHFVYAVPTQMTPDKSTPRIITIDSGETNNSFALTMWSVIKAASPIVTGADEEDAYAYEDEDEDIQVILDTMRELKEKEPEKEATKGMSTYLRNDGTIEVIPFKENNVSLHKVHYKKMYDLCIIPIVKAFNIIAVVADRWNMASIFHGLAEEGIMCHHYTLTWNDFKDFKKKTNDRELLLLPLEKPYEKVFEDYDEAIKDAPNLHLIVQMKTVRKVGRQVVKPKGGTDDLYRTTVLAHRFAMNDNPKDVAVNHLGIPYLTIMETSGVGERQSRGMGVVLMRRDVVRHRVHGDTQISGIGGYTSARNHISRKKQRGSY